MPYKGDYYGDYYRGDPGIFSSIGKFLGGAVKGVAGFLTGGPVGALNAILPQQQARQLPMIAPPRQAIDIRGPFGTGIGLGPAVGTIPTIAPQGMNGGCGTSVCCLPTGGRGRMNKSTYVTRGGGTSRWPSQLIVHPKGTECVKPRRMNPANPAALRRAIRRGRGAVKLLRGAAGAMGYTVVTKAALAQRPKARKR